jgi:hypothetical protein
VYYLSFLEAMHARLRPSTYLEIGVASGKSLRLATCRSVGIDPGYAITVPVDGDVALFRTSSDEYFARPDPLAPTSGRPFDLAFIDGLHLFEFALRDFINAERHSSTRSMIVFDDVLPRTVDEAARQRHTDAWTGDVYPILQVLERFRPELIVLPVDTQPTGLLLVVGLDPTSTTLVESYDAVLAEYRHADPQPVPSDVMDRLTALPPRRVLESGFWEILAEAVPSAAPAELRERLNAEVSRSLGSAFVEGARAGSTSH